MEIGIMSPEYYAEAAGKRVMSLPMHPYLEGDEQKRIVEAVLASYAK